MTDIKREIRADYSTYLEDPRHLEDEIVAWELPKHVAEQQQLANDVLRVCRRFGLRNVLEVGCGIGWLKGLLPEDIRYTGVDANACCIEEARRRHGGNFWVCDVRDLNPVVEYPLVCSFSFLKHFGLHEWVTILSSVLSFGRFAIFNLRIADNPKDDGGEYPNVWVSQEMVGKALEQGHSEILWERVTSCGEGWKECVLVTRRIQA